MLGDLEAQLRVRRVERDRIDLDPLVVPILVAQPLRFIRVHLEEMKLGDPAKLHPGRV